MSTINIIGLRINSCSETLFEILTKFQISYLFQHSCFNHIWVDPNLDHRLPMQQEWNWWQIWNSVIDQKPKPNAKWSIFCLFERLLEFLVAYNSVIWAPQLKVYQCPTIHHKSPFASPIRHCCILLATQMDKWLQERHLLKLSHL